MLGGSVMIAVSTLTKYFGMALIPLLIAYSLAVRRRAGLWLLYFLVPVGAIGTYQVLTAKYYGRGLIFGAMREASRFYTVDLVVLAEKAFTGLAFTGDAFGYHMWTEVYTDGRWVAYDGTLGDGVVPATHIAMMKSVHEDEVMGVGSLRFLDIVRNISVDFEWYRLRDGDKIYAEETVETQPVH